MSKSNHWMPLYVGDYLADTMHLGAREHGAYLLLLMHEWKTGPLPDDDRQLSFIARCDLVDWSLVGPLVRPFFTAENGRLYQKRLEEERARQQNKLDQRRSAGRASAEQRNRQREVNERSTGAQRNGQQKGREPEPEPDKEGTLPSGSKDPYGSASPAEAGDPPPPNGKVPKPPVVTDAVLWDMAVVWNEIAAPAGLPSVSELTPRRRQQLRARIAERWKKDPLGKWRTYVEAITASEFLRGGGSRGWRADFDWALQPKNVIAVAEGKYRNDEGEG